MTDPTVQAYEQRAREAESSPIPTFLKIGRVIVWIVYALALITALLLIIGVDAFLQWFVRWRNS